MKKRQKRRFFALLTSLCLVLGICVVPIAAEEEAADLKRLEQEMLAAKEEAERTRDAFERAEAAGEKAALTEAERAARVELAEAEAALEAAGEDWENRAGLEERVEDAGRKIDEIFEQMAAADARVRDAQNAAAEAAALAAQKQDAYDAAREAAAEAERRKQEEEEKRKLEEEQRRKEEEQKKQEEEQRRKEEEERKKREEEEQKKREEEERRRQEEEQKRGEEEKRREEEKLQSLTPGSADLSFSVSGIDFGSLEKGASGGLSRSFTLTNNSAGHTMFLSASGLPGFSVSGVPASLAPGKSAVVSVSLSGAKAGEYGGNLSVSGWYEDGGLKGSPRTFSLPIRARVTEKAVSISVSPSFKDLGRLTEGYGEGAAGEKKFTVTVENKSADGVWLDGVKGAEHFSVSSGSGWLDPGGRTGFAVVPKQGLKAGSYTDKIVFQTREGASAECSVTMEVERRGEPLAVEPGALDFGSAEEGYSALSAKTVTVKNNTDYEMRLEQPVSYSYDISLLDNVPLAAGASAVFAIRPRTGLPANFYGGVIEVRSSGGETAKLQVKFTVNRPAGPTAFMDVEPGSTFAGDIAYVSQNGLMSGKGGGFFRPQEAVTRGQIVTVLYRLEGRPAASGAGFPDVAAGSYCEEAVKWAASAGVAGGDRNGLFRPDDPVSREQLAAFLYRYNNYKGYESGRLADLGTFPDGGSAAAYAREALAWANGAGLINGTAAGRLNPSGGATRGQAAAILHRFCVRIGR